MRKLMICAIALAMVGCKSEYEKSEVSVRPDGDGRLVHTVDGDVISGTVVSKASDGTLKSRVVVKDGVLHGEAIENRHGRPYKVSNFADGRLTGVYEQFCDDGKHEIKRNITSWPETYGEETFSCETGNQLNQINLVDGKPVGEQIVWIEADGKQILQSKLNYDDKGKFHGESSWFTQKGRQFKLAKYKNGVLDGEYLEYQQGTDEIRYKGLYKDGKKIGLWVTPYGSRLTGEDSINPEDVRGQVLVSLGIQVSSPDHNFGSSADRPYQTDLKKAQFYIDQGKVDFKKPFSINQALENFISSTDGQQLYKFMPITNLVHEETLEWVLERGADLNATDFEGKNRLMKCVETAYSGCTIAHIAKLLDVTDIKAVDIKGRNVLHMACAAVHGDDKKVAEIRNLVLATGDVNTQDNYGWTPLHYCLSNGLMDEARDLIARGADVNIKAENNATAAHMVWLTTSPEPGSSFQADWGKNRQQLAVELNKAGKLSYHTELPAFEETIRDLAMKNGNIDLVQHIDMVEPM